MDSVFECDLFFEPDAVSRVVISDGKVDLSSVVRFTTDSLSPDDLSKLVRALRDSAVMIKDDKGVVVDSRLRVAFLKAKEE